MPSSPLPNIEISRRATRDLRKLTGTDVRRVRGTLESLSAGAENLDVKAVANRPPWLRLRVGELRVLYRPLTDEELGGSRQKWLVSRVIHRRELDRAIASLDP
jgi:mRNA-degrading endonuclease RelE of RelBE toxin-antitoxin system